MIFVFVDDNPITQRQRSFAATSHHWIQSTWSGQSIFYSRSNQVCWIEIRLFPQKQPWISSWKQQWFTVQPLKQEPSAASVNQFFHKKLVTRGACYMGSSPHEELTTWEIHNMRSSQHEELIAWKNHKMRSSKTKELTWEAQHFFKFAVVNKG